jgi:hypothetical protein
MKNILKNLLLILLSFASLQVFALDFTYTKHAWFGAQKSLPFLIKPGISFTHRLLATRL